MQLNYLLFDTSDEESGHGSFDAMATVAADRLDAVLAEVSEVLRWAQQAFGPAGALEEGAEWDFAQQSDAAGGGLTTVTLTVSGSPAFCEALGEQFELAD